MNKQIEQYRNIELSTEVMSASSHRLIQLLFEHVLQHIRLAKLSIANSDSKQKCKHLDRAHNICEYLRLCLIAEDKKTQELAELLTGIYIRCEKNFFYAALQNDVTFLDEATLMLTNVKEGWDGIQSQVGTEHA